MAGRIKKGFDTLKDNLYTDITHKLQEKGYVPVFRVVTQNRYDDTELGTRLLIDTLPADARMRVKVKLRNDYLDRNVKIGGASIGGSFAQVGDTLESSARDVVSQTVGSIKDNIIASFSGQMTADDRPLLGFKVDMSHRNPYPWANVIFHNPTISNPAGDELVGSIPKGNLLYSSDLMKVGFPVWIYAGFVDQSVIGSTGNVVAHPFDDRTQDHIPLIFTGLVGAMKQEGKESGDRMIIQCVGYEWYLQQFENQFAITVSEDETIIGAINRVFLEFYNQGGSTMPGIIAKAMRLDKSNNCAPEVRYVYGATSTMKPVRGRYNAIDGTIFLGEGEHEENFLTVLNRVQRIYNVDIDWDVNGYLIVRGWNNPFTRIKKYVERKSEPGPYPRIHDAIIGGNVRNWEFAVDAQGTASSVNLRVVRSDGEHAETHHVSRTTIEEIINTWEKDDRRDEMLELLGLERRELRPTTDDEDYFRLFGHKTLALDVFHSVGRDEEESDDDLYVWPYKALTPIARRMHYWGLRGSIMIMGNAHVREGDLVRITDIRPKGESVLNVNMEAVRNTVSDIAERVKGALAGVSEGEEPSPELAIKMFDNVFYVWKVNHYAGPAGFWTKLFFIKQRDAYMSPTGVMRELSRASTRDNLED